MNIRIFNLNGQEKELNEGYKENDNMIINVKNSTYYEVANEDIKGDCAYVGLKCEAGDFGLIMYGERKYLRRDLILLNKQLKYITNKLEQ